MYLKTLHATVHVTLRDEVDGSEHYEVVNLTGDELDHLTETLYLESIGESQSTETERKDSAKLYRLFCQRLWKVDPLVPGYQVTPVNSERIIEVLFEIEAFDPRTRDSDDTARLVAQSVIAKEKIEGVTQIDWQNETTLWLHV